MRISFRLFLCGLATIGLISPAAAAAERDVTPWQKLSEAQRRLWRDAVAPVFCLGVSGEVNDPEAKYRILHSSSGKAASRDPVTTVAAYEDRYMELQIALNLLEARLRSSLEEPTVGVLKEWAATMPAVFPPTDRVDLQSIHIRKFQSETTESAKKRADSAWRMLQDGTSFSQVAIWCSDARSSAIGGSAGTITSGTVAPEVERVIFALKEGETTGPIEREHGYHIYRVIARKMPFSLDRPEDAERARQLWLDFQLRQRVQTMTDAWLKNKKIEVREAPQSTTEWLDEPWILYGEGTSEPFGLVYQETSRCDLSGKSPPNWGDFWRGEGIAQSSMTLTRLAALELVRNSQEYGEALELSRALHPGWSFLRQWWFTCHPNEQQLQSYFEARATELFPPIPHYTLLLWQVPVRPLEGEKPREHTLRIQTMLNRVYDAVRNDAPTTVPATQSLFERLSKDFPGSSWQQLNDTEAVGPFVDPILIRTKVGALSRPFDTQGGVGLAFMISQRTEHADLPGVRPSAEYDWRVDQLGSFLKKLLTENSIPPH